MKGTAQSPEAFLAALPADRRATLSAVRAVILANLPTGYEECLQGQAISYVVPLRLYPAGYHCQPGQPLAYAWLGAQKNHLTFNLMTVYGDPEISAWFKEAFAAAGKKLDMGQCCVRFKQLSDLPLDVIGQAIARVPLADYVARVAAVLQRPRQQRPVKRASVSNPKVSRRKG